MCVCMNYDNMNDITQVLETADTKKTDILRLFFNYWFLSNWLIFHDYGLGLVPQWSPVKPLCTAGT